MSRSIMEKLDALLTNVPTSRRQALKRLLAGGGALALLPAATLLADEQQPRRPGKGKGGGKGGGAIIAYITWGILAVALIIWAASGTFTSSASVASAGDCTPTTTAQSICAKSPW